MKRENLFRISAIIIVLVLVSAAALAYFEPKIGYYKAVWWSIVTVTTVGYGDISPETAGGKVVASIIMFLGIGIIGTFTATIAGIFVEKKLKEDRGMSSYNFENHIILCEWNNRAREILNELRMDARCAETPIVLIANIEMKPVTDDYLFFIQGAVNEENLNRANVHKAKTVLILGKDNLDDNARDAQSVLSTLAVESMNREAYTIVELVDEKNVRHCERANADEIIVGAEFSSKLISRAALDHGISKVISELLSSKIGNDLNMLTLEPMMVGKNFMEVFTEMKKNANVIVLAVQKKQGGRVVSNPPADHKMEAGDQLIVISPTKKDNQA
ncbi:MAG: potassium channel family protein [bacterium]